MLEPGMKVPDFTLHDANGNAVSLHDRASKTVVYRSIPRAVFMYDRVGIISEIPGALGNTGLRGFFSFSWHYSGITTSNHRVF